MAKVRVRRVKKRKLKRGYIYAVFFSGFAVLAYLFLAIFIFKVYDPNKTIVVAGGALRIPYNIEFLNSFTLVLLIALFPLGVVSFLDYRRRKSIERNLPIFLRDLAELVRTGTPLTKAIEELSLRNYEALTPLLKKLTLRVMFGEDLGDAVDEVFKEESPTTRKLALMMAEAYYSGGKAAEVLRTASNFALLLQRFDDEKQRELRVYGMIVYMAIVIYLIVSAILLYMDISMFSTIGVARGARGFAITLLPPEQVKAVLYYASIVLMMASAAILSKVRYGVMGPGILHLSVLLVVIMIYYTYIEVIVSLLMGIQVPQLQPTPVIRP